MSHSERDQEVLSFFPLSFPLPNPETLGRAAGRGHLRSFLQHRQRRPPRGGLRSARIGRAARGRGSRRARRGVCGSRRGDRGAAGRPRVSPPTRGRRARPRPPRGARSLPPSLSSLSNVFLPGREKLKGRTEKALCSLILRVSGQKLT